MNFEDTGHRPVLLEEVVGVLKPNSNETYFDATFGNGGYSERLLEMCDCNIIAIDQDPNVQEKANQLKKKYNHRFNFYKSKFSEISKVMKKAEQKKVNGFTFDIGVSSMQLDNSNRGFSFMRDGPLDMRMNSRGPTAADLINTLKEDELADIIYHYGDEHKARKIARRITEYRKNHKISTTNELVEIIKKCFPGKYYKKHPATKTFQSIRIYLNNEIEELCAGLNNSVKYLVEGGKLCVVSFHSLEDRIIKNFFKFSDNNLTSNTNSFLKCKNKVIKPTENEVKNNSRSRSAKLRFGIRSKNLASEISLSQLGLN